MMALLAVIVYKRKVQKSSEYKACTTQLKNRRIKGKGKNGSFYLPLNIIAPLRETWDVGARFPYCMLPGMEQRHSFVASNA
jgi:hypothetical protein